MSPTKYPENILDTIPVTGEMLVPANVPSLIIKRAKSREKTAKQSDSEMRIKGGSEVRAEIAVSRLRWRQRSRASSSISLEGSQDFGGAKSRVSRESRWYGKGLPRIITKATNRRMKKNMIFFLYYNRGAFDKDEGL